MEKKLAGKHAAAQDLTRPRVFHPVFRLIFQDYARPRPFLVFYISRNYVSYFATPNTSTNAWSNINLVLKLYSLRLKETRGLAITIVSVNMFIYLELYTYLYIYIFIYFECAFNKDSFK